MRRIAMALSALVVALAVYAPVALSHPTHARALGIVYIPPSIVAPSADTLVAYEQVGQTTLYSDFFDGANWRGWTPVITRPTPGFAAGGIGAMGPYGNALFIVTEDGKLWYGVSQNTAQWNDWSGAKTWDTHPRDATPAVVNYG